jgi:hypothetical protein
MWTLFIKLDEVVNSFHMFPKLDKHYFFTLDAICQNQKYPSNACPSPYVDWQYLFLGSKILPGITHWQSPKFFGYHPLNVSTAGILGEILSGGLDVTGFSRIMSPAVTELEIIVWTGLGNSCISQRNSFHLVMPHTPVVCITGFQCHTTVRSTCRVSSFSSCSLWGYEVDSPTNFVVIFPWELLNLELQGRVGVHARNTS